MENSCQILVIAAHRLQIAFKKVVIEEEEAVKKKVFSKKCKTVVRDLRQHHTVKISAPHNKCTALKYTNGIIWFETQTLFSMMDYNWLQTGYWQ